MNNWYSSASVQATDNKDFNTTAAAEGNVLVTDKPIFDSTVPKATQAEQVSGQ